MAKEYRYGRLGYNSQNDRYGLLDCDLWVYDGFHCGECLEVKIDGKWVKTSMEMFWDENGGTWYLTNTSYRGSDLEYLQARIEK